MMPDVGRYFLVGNSRDLRPLGEVLSSCVFDLDATIAASYSGSGGWLNYEPTPADGSGQSAYDFTNNGATFSGSVGGTNGQFNFDGNDYFQITGGNTNFLRDLHKNATGSDFTLILIAEHAPSDSGSFFATVDGSGSGNIGILFGSTSSATELRFRQSVNNNNNFIASAALVTGDLTFFACGRDQGTQSRLWMDNTTSEQSTHSWTATTSNATSDAKIGRGGGILLPNGSIVKAVSMFNAYLSNAQLQSIIEQYQRRHQRSYL